MWCQGKQKIGRHTDLLVWSNWPHGVQWFVFSCSPEQSPTGAEAGVPVPSTLLFTLMVSRCWRQGQWNLWDAAKEWKRPKKTLRIFFHFIFKETGLLFAKITFIYNSSALSNPHACTSFSLPSLFLSLFVRKQLCNATIQAKAMQISFFSLGILSSFSCNTVDVQKWSENPSKNFRAGTSPRECQQWWESLRRLWVQVCFGMAVRSLQNSTKLFQTSEPLKSGKGSKTGRAGGTFISKARKQRRPRERKLWKEPSWSLILNSKKDEL